MTFINLKKNMKPITLNREVHKWAGIGLSVFILVITVTGFVLIHEKEWKWLKKVDVPDALIPGWAAEGMIKKAGHIKAMSVVPAPNGGEPVLMAGTPVGLLTQDNGTWKSSAMTTGPVEVTAMLLTTRQWLIGTNRGLFQSDDEGRNWAAVTEGALGKSKGMKISTIQQSPFDSQTVFLGTKMGAYRSTDGGSHWESLNDRFPPTTAMAEDKEMLEKAREVNTIAFDSNRPEMVFFGTQRGVYRYDQQSDLVVSLDLGQMVALAATTAPKMTLGKYLNDLHTGKLFADKLWTLYDLTALSLVLFVGTGFYIWIYPKSVKWRKEREEAKMTATHVASLARTQDQSLPLKG